MRQIEVDLNAIRSNYAALREAFAPAKVIAIAEEGDSAVGKSADEVFFIPQTHPFMAAQLAVLPLQIFALELAGAKGLDVDQPRNLAKSVTVE